VAECWGEEEKEVYEYVVWSLVYMRHDRFYVSYFIMSSTAEIVMVSRRGEYFLFCSGELS